MYPFSPIALQQLHDAGWTEDRRIDISDYERKVQELGFELFPCVREFLTRFGNLEFSHTRRVPVRGGLGANVPPGVWRDERTIWLSTALQEPNVWQFVGLAANRTAIHLTLQSIGDDRGSDEWLAMDSRGRVYGGNHWGWINLYAAQGEDGLEACITRRPALQSYWDDDTSETEEESTPDLDAARKMWREYVERTGIIPPDDVIDLLIPEAQEAIREAARR
jgi:hypothetical protein